MDPLGNRAAGISDPAGRRVYFRVPTPHELGFNGSFNAFRVLEQDAAAFEAYLDQSGDDS